MKKHLSLMLLSTATLFLSACSSSSWFADDKTNEDNNRIVQGDNEKDTTTLIMKVADQSTSCKLDNKRQCLLVKTGNHGDWRQFTNVIEGFTYQQGYEYLLEVRKYPANPEDKNSKDTYRLINQIMKEKAM